MPAFAGMTVGRAAAKAVDAAPAFAGVTAPV
jgi:hypothetical protein